MRGDRTKPLPADRFAAIFGKSTAEPGDPGRKRLCKVCGGWHRLDQPWPHNCRPERDIPPQILTAPMVIGDIEPHKHGEYIITTREEQREFMRRTGAVEAEDFTPTAGTGKQDFTSREYKEDLVQDIKRAIETDPLSVPPPLMIEEANSGVDETEKVSTEGMEVITE